MTEDEFRQAVVDHVRSAVGDRIVAIKETEFERGWALGYQSGLETARQENREDRRRQGLMP